MTKFTEAVICLLHKRRLHDDSIDRFFFSDMNNELLHAPLDQNVCITSHMALCNNNMGKRDTQDIKQYKNYIKLEFDHNNEYITIKKYYSRANTTFRMWICKQQEIILIQEELHLYNIDTMWKPIITLTDPDSLNQLDNYLIELLGQVSHD